MASISNASQDSIDLTSIKPFRSEPIKKVPKYLFENSNQERRDYDSRYLILLRSKAQTIKPSEIKAYKITANLQVKRAEEFDWVFGLDQLEKEYLAIDGFMDTVLKIEDILKLNRYLSRLAQDQTLRDSKIKNHTPGKLRTEEDFCQKYPLDIYETAVHKYIISKIKILCGEDFTAILSGPNVEQEKKILIPTLEIQNHLLIKKTFYAFILNSTKNNTTVNNSITLQDVEKMNLEDVKSWEFLPGQVELISWVRKRFHFFPAPSKIEKELQESIDSIKDPKMHPIEKAAKIWFDIARIRVFNDANMKTAKAIGCAILLNHGYLPPVIGEEDYQEYIDCIEKGFGEKDGHIRLTNFIANQILKTQKRFKDDSRDISELS